MSSERGLGGERHQNSGKPSCLNDEIVCGSYFIKTVSSFINQKQMKSVSTVKHFNQPVRSFGIQER